MDRNPNGEDAIAPAGGGARGDEPGDAAPSGERESHSGADLARQALEQAKADARRRGAAPGRPRGAGSDARDDPCRQSSGRDPLPLAGAIDELLSVRGWELQASVATIFARWSEIVGAEVAAHTKPETFDDGDLVVVADSAAWATQVRLLSRSLVGRLRDALGENAVRRVRVHGPAGRASGGDTGISGARRS